MHSVTIGSETKYFDSIMVVIGTQYTTIDKQFKLVNGKPLQVSYKGSKLRKAADNAFGVYINEIKCKMTDRIIDINQSQQSVIVSEGGNVYGKYMFNANTLYPRFYRVATVNIKSS